MRSSPNKNENSLNEKNYNINISWSLLSFPPSKLGHGGHLIIPLTFFFFQNMSNSCRITFPKPTFILQPLPTTFHFSSGASREAQLLNGALRAFPQSPCWRSVSSVPRPWQAVGNFKNKLYQASLVAQGSGKESACQHRGHRFDLWSEKIPHDVGQLSPWVATTGARVPRAHAPQEKPPQGEGSAPHEEQPLLPTTSNKDPTQPKINKWINKSKKKKE